MSLFGLLLHILNLLSILSDLGLERDGGLVEDILAFVARLRRVRYGVMGLFGAGSRLGSLIARRLVADS
jgi:hypothetical protein